MAAKTDQKTPTSAWRPATRLVHEGTLRSQFGETSEAIFLNSGYVYRNAEQAEARFKGDEEGFVYSRYANPTVAMFEARMCALEGAEAARGTSSGMAAVAASLLSHSRPATMWFRRARCSEAAATSSKICCRATASRAPWSTAAILAPGKRPCGRPRAPCSSRRRPIRCSSSWTSRAWRQIAHKVGALVVVDNVFATPLLQRPMPLGADIVVYSATKHIDGQGRCLGGVVLGNKEFIEEKLHNYLKHTGPSLSPFNAWVLLKGLETLPLRVERHAASAAAIADFLAEREVARVFYPGRADHPQAALAKRQMQGGGPMVSFEVEGDKRTPSAS